MRMVTPPISKGVPMDSIAGIAMVNFLTLLVLGLVYALADSVSRLELSVPEAITHLRRLGQGTSRHNLPIKTNGQTPHHNPHE
ncbi:MAG TPA: hypothetical protein ENH72_12750 [Pseudomonas sabulinigri]|uniref:Uncharacterized protein n=1 Tax=marine sediment metagenome TaxID=412755 RepID=A0A0F9XM83_9ZZZZ|nr:hypothetical protein [Halopseudomonas sabulinigri]HEC53588.1 hypothetical protein [Halopseudomonas sabulinigri]